MKPPITIDHTIPRIFFIFNVVSARGLLLADKFAHFGTSYAPETNDFRAAKIPPSEVARCLVFRSKFFSWAY